MPGTAIFSKDFTLVVMGQIVSVFGNQILRYALPLYLLNQTGSAVLFGTIMALSFIPMIILFPVGGIIADRLNKRNIMVLLDFATALLIFLFYMLAGKMDLVPLMAITMFFLYGIQGAYQPAVKASVPVLVQTEHMMKANSVIDMINSISSMAGPVLGGLLFSLFGLTPVLYVSMACFFASAVMELFIHIPFEKRKTRGNILATGLGDLKESFHFIFRTQPVLWQVSLIFAASNLLLTSLLLIGVPVIVTQYLGFAPEVANRLYGYAQGVIATGAILGGVCAGFFPNRLKSTASPLLLIGCALALVMAGFALHNLHTAMGIYLVLLVGCGLLLTLHTLFQIQMMTCLQRLTPENLLGKVISCFMCVVLGTLPMGQFLYGLVFEQLGSSTYIPFYVAGFTMMGISICTRHIFYSVDRLIEQRG